MKKNLSDVIYENCSKINDKKNKSKFEKYRWVIHPPMQLRIFLKVLEYNSGRYEYFINNNKVALPSQHCMSFSCIDDEVVSILVLIKMHVGKYMYSGNY